MLASLLAFAQTQQIKGRVVDENGQPVNGASVLIKGSKNGTFADANGNFTISVKQKDVLIFSGVGNTSKEIRIAPNTSSLNVTLIREGQNLSEVVVTTALGVRRQSKELGYSTATINNKELTQASVTNIASGLAAKASGVDIRLTDNSINPQVKITFRGSRSITGSNAALVVVDGNPVDPSYIAALNPDDIDNISILKGSNAAALYGKEASNGVLIISTKHGSKGSAWVINYKNSTMAEKVSYLPKLQIQYSPYGGEGGGYNDPRANGGCIGCISYIDPLTGSPLPVPFENQNFGPAYNSLDFPYSQIAIGGPDSLGNIKYGPYQGYKDGRKSFFKTGLTEQNDLSVSKGGKLGSFFISGQNVYNKGVIYKDKYTRNTITANGNLNLGKFSASGGISYSSQNVDQAGQSYTGQNQYRPVYWNVINQAPNVNLADYNNAQTDYFSSFQGYINGYYPNPWIQVYNSRIKQTNHNVITNLKLDYKILDWLNLTVRGGYNKRSRNIPSHIDSTIFPTYHYGIFASSPTRDPWASGGTASSNASLPYQNELVKTTLEDLNTDAFLTIRKSVKDFTFTIIPGLNYRVQNSTGYWFSNQVTTPLSIPSGFTKVSNPDGSAYQNLSYKYRSQSLYSDFSIGYENWAFLHGSFRNDWISTLDPETRSFNYYGVDASLVLSDKIDALKASKVISFLKLRGGYSITGNVNLGGTTGFGFLGGGSIPNFGAYSIYPAASVGTGFPYTGINGYSLSNTNVQKGLRPEKDASAEIGFEIGFLKDRIRLEGAVYNTIATDQTLPVQTSTASGITNFTLNTGKMRSRGYEIDLKFSPLINLGKFKWNVMVNFSQIDNKVLALLPGRDTLSLYNGFFGTSNAYSINAIVGQPYPYLLVKDFTRDPNGHIIVDRTTGMPTSNPHFVGGGNTEYKYRLGLTSNMSYKRFSFVTVWDYRSGAKILNELGNALDFAGISASSAENRQHFVIPNSVIEVTPGKYETNTNIPITGSSAAWWSQIYNGVATPYLVSAAFWKLREVSIGYDIPVNKFGNFKGIKKATFSLIGQNLLMIRPKTNQWTDPEFSLNGTSNAVGATDDAQTPPTRRYGFSLNVTF